WEGGGDEYRPGADLRLVPGSVRLGADRDGRDRVLLRGVLAARGVHLPRPPSSGGRLRTRFPDRQQRPWRDGGRAIDRAVIIVLYGAFARTIHGRHGVPALAVDRRHRRLRAG